MFGIIGSERQDSRMGSPSSVISSTNSSPTTHFSIWRSKEGKEWSPDFVSSNSNPIQSGRWSKEQTLAPVKYHHKQEEDKFFGSGSLLNRSNSFFGSPPQRFRHEDALGRTGRSKFNYRNKKPVEVHISDAFMDSLSRLDLSELTNVESRIQEQEMQKVPIPEYWWPTNLSPKYSHYPDFSRKVFLGGIPLDLTDADLCCKFKDLPVKIEWPLPGGARARLPHECMNREPLKGGYVFIVFEDAETVDMVLNTMCQGRRGNWRVRLSSWSVCDKQVQVIPWDMNCNSYSVETPKAMDSEYTVFLGGVHGQVTAKDIFLVMNSLFRNVVSTELEVDPNGFPIGTAHVTFHNRDSYLRALAAHYVDTIGTHMERRRVQIEPFLVTDAVCSLCNTAAGPYFCKDFGCLKYYCIQCFRRYHMNLKLRPDQCLESHIPMMKAKGAVQRKVSHYLMSSIILEMSHPGKQDSPKDRDIQ